MKSMHLLVSYNETEASAFIVTGPVQLTFPH